MDASDIAVQVLLLNDERYWLLVHVHGAPVPFGHYGLLIAFPKLYLCVRDV